jgi:alkaline phosphatase D
MLRDASPLLLAALLAAWGCGPPAQLTHGVAAGEVTASTAIVWGRCDRAATLAVALEAANGARRTAEAAADAAQDFTARVRFDRLDPASDYRYAAMCRGALGRTGSAVGGRFRTAPRADDPRPVRVAWGGDVGGQNVCRDRAEGYAIFDRLADLTPDCFVALGDMVYADDPCHPRGRYGNEQVPGPPRAADLAGYWAHWQYNRADPALQRFLATTSYYAVWDDHEIGNDAGPHHDSPRDQPGLHLLPIARAAFLAYQPLLPVPGDDPILYRTARWGRHLELFFLDTRQYRDANAARDDPARPKTLLGAGQRQWLIDSLRRSHATWKVVVSSVPLAVPTGGPAEHDGWADGGDGTGFEQEVRTILRAFGNGGVRNLVWLTTDVHFAAAFRYAPPEIPGFTFHEFISGPLHAGIFPHDRLDPTLGPERLWRLDFPDPDAPHPFADARPRFNFGTLDLDAAGALTVRIVNAAGDVLFAHTLRPDAA